jgi:hypothetical protein
MFQSKEGYRNVKVHKKMHVPSYLIRNRNHSQYNLRSKGSQPKEPPGPVSTLPSTLAAESKSEDIMKSYMGSLTGKTVAVILDAATGAIVFTQIFLLAPSFARVLASPRIPIYAVLDRAMRTVKINHLRGAVICLPKVTINSCT